MATGKVIVIDDEPLITGLIKQVLSGEGYDTLACNDAEEGLSVVESEEPDLILLDITMPKMNGYEFCRQMQEKQIAQETPVIFLSGKSAEEDGGRSFEAGAASYIQKPFSNTALKEIVNLTMSSLGHF